MKKFLIKIAAYGYITEFKVMANDSSQELENAILDKLGEKGIVWENLGDSYHTGLNRITYEEVINDTRPVQTKKVLGVEVATGASR